MPATKSAPVRLGSVGGATLSTIIFLRPIQSIVDTRIAQPLSSPPGSNNCRLRDRQMVECEGAFHPTSGFWRHREKIQHALNG
jgi:hypothetical protein